MRRVVVTGMGAVTPLGNSMGECWISLGRAVSGIREATRLDVSEIPWKLAGEIRGFDSTRYLGRKERKRLDVFVHYAVAAACMAAEDAGLIEDRGHLTGKGADRAYLMSGGVVVGSSRGGISSLEKAYFEMNRRTGCGSSRHSYPPATIMPASTVSMAASFAAQRLQMRGHCLGISNACASGANAVGEAFRLLKAGYGGPVLAGGSDAPLCRMCVEGYGISGALSRVPLPTACRPFDARRDGFVLAEGACILVLEEYERAKSRGADIYGEVIGYGNTTDAFHMTRPDPRGESDCIRMALDDAGVPPSAVDHISAHGTSTRLGDEAEYGALREVFGSRAEKIPVSAVKSSTGHMLAASGAFEAASAVLALKEKFIPPSLNLEQPDPLIPLNVVTEGKRVDVNVAITNSFGFGGVNAVLVLAAL